MLHYCSYSLNYKKQHFNIPWWPYLWNDVPKWLVLTHNSQLCISLPNSMINDITFVLGDNSSLVSYFLHILWRVVDYLCYDPSFQRGLYSKQMRRMAFFLWAKDKCLMPSTIQILFLSGKRLFASCPLWMIQALNSGFLFCNTHAGVTYTSLSHLWDFRFGGWHKFWYSGNCYCYE